jgi:hypothetical protein
MDVHERSLLLAAYSGNVYTDSHQLVSRRSEVQRGERERERERGGGERMSGTEREISGKQIISIAG